MTLNTGLFFVDVLNILPEEIDCFIQAPSLENHSINNMMRETEFDYYKLIRLNEGNRKEFIKEVMVNLISNYIQNIQIKYNGKLLFEGFDGVEFGTISKEVELPEWFKEKYILTEECEVSTEW